MNKVAHASAQDRSDLFSATAAKMNITPAAAEKDFWIVWSLQQLFSLPNWAERLRFKGGTSLSKAYGLIERFSEDIDLILDWQADAHRNALQVDYQAMQEMIFGDTPNFDTLMHTLDSLQQRIHTLTNEQNR